MNNGFKSLVQEIGKGSPLFCLKPNGDYGLVGIAFENQAASATSDTLTIFTNVNKWRDSFINKVKSGE